MTQLMTDGGRIVRVPSGTWKVDPTRSSVGFEVEHMMIPTVRGHFRDFDGTREAAEDDPANSCAWEVASIETGNAERDEHLRSPDFFDADRCPGTLRFDAHRAAAVCSSARRCVCSPTSPPSAAEGNGMSDPRHGIRERFGEASLGDAQSQNPRDDPDMIEPDADPLDTDVEDADLFLGDDGDDDDDAGLR